MKPKLIHMGTSRARLSHAAMIPVIILCALSQATAQVSVVTQHNDNARTGQNLNETILSTSNVSVNQFGKLFTRTVNGNINAQPLYMPNVSIPSKGTHNVVYVVTAHNNVYAFDADNPAAATPLWTVKLGLTVPGGYGITATPVIDPATNTLYVVHEGNENTTVVFHLHALDIATGAEKFGGPVVIQASVPGTGYDSDTGVITFNAYREFNRPGLLLANGQIYIAFGSHGDHDPYHGWVMAYDKSTLAQTAVWCASPNGEQGAVWQSAQGLASDGNGSVYLVTGNGTFDYNVGGTSLGDTVVKFNANLTVSDWFTPYNQDALNALDNDLGTAGVMFLPGTNDVVVGSKLGKLYVIDSTNLGHFHAGSDSQIIQRFQAVFGSDANGPDSVHGTVAWNSPNNGLLLYTWGDNDHVRAFQFSGGHFNTTAVAEGTTTVGAFTDVGLSVSASGSSPGSGILWATYPNSAGDAVSAYDASNIAVELWNSNQNRTRDALGSYAKFNCATVANGKVYAPTFSNQLVVYGLLTFTAPPPTPTGLTAMGGNGQVSLSWSASSGATSYNVKRGSVSGGPYATITSVSTTSATDSGLTNGTAYYYVVSAVNTVGESANSAEASATPLLSIPAAPAGLTAMGGNGQVSLSWSASTGATSYNVKRGSVSGGPYATITSVSTTNATDSGLTNGTAYYYVVSAVDAAGESGNSGEARATPAPPAAVTLKPLADAMVRAGTYADTNSGLTGVFIVKRLTNDSTSTYNRCSYLKFDLTGVTTAPSSAKLTLTVNAASTPNGSTETVTAYGIADMAWTESGITWNNAPGLNRTNFTSTGTAITSQPVLLTPGTIDIDLTPYVQSHLGQIVTIQLIDLTIDNKLAEFNSKEASSGKPTLTITP